MSTISDPLITAQKTHIEKEKNKASISKGTPDYKKELRIAQATTAAHARAAVQFRGKWPPPYRRVTGEPGVDSPDL